TNFQTFVCLPELEGGSNATDATTYDEHIAINLSRRVHIIFLDCRPTLIIQKSALHIQHSKLGERLGLRRVRRGDSRGVRGDNSRGLCRGASRSQAESDHQDNCDQQRHRLQSWQCAHLRRACNSTLIVQPTPCASSGDVLVINILRTRFLNFRFVAQSHRAQYNCLDWEVVSEWTPF